MARMTVNGIDLADQRMGRMDRTMIRQIVEAGAGAAEARMRENTLARRHVRTGDMLGSVGRTEYQEFYNGGQTSVYPLGLDRRGERNATKAFVLNWGRGRKLKGDKFITGDEDKAEEIIRQAMQDESDRLVAEREE